MFIFRVPDMTCGHCAATIARAVASVDKAARVEISIPEKLVRVSSRSDQAELAEAIADAGYSAQAIHDASAPGPSPRGSCGSAGTVAQPDRLQAGSKPRSSCCCGSADRSH